MFTAHSKSDYKLLPTHDEDDFIDSLDDHKALSVNQHSIQSESKEKKSHFDKEELDRLASDDEVRSVSLMELDNPTFHTLQTFLSDQCLSRLGQTARFFKQKVDDVFNKSDRIQAKIIKLNKLLPAYELKQFSSHYIENDIKATIHTSMNHLNQALSFKNFCKETCLPASYYPCVYAASAGFVPPVAVGMIGVLADALIFASCCCCCSTSTIDDFCAHVDFCRSAEDLSAIRSSMKIGVEFGCVTGGFHSGAICVEYCFQRREWQHSLLVHEKLLLAHERLEKKASPKIGIVKQTVSKAPVFAMKR